MLSKVLSLIILLSCISSNTSKYARQDAKRIKNLRESNDALELRVENLSEKVETQENQINKLRTDNFNLKYQLQEFQQLF